MNAANTPPEGESDSIQTHDGPDYASLSPGAKPPSELSYAERRAEILEQVEDVGHPASLNQNELAERYGVDQSTISRDLDRLDEYVRSQVGRRHDLEIASTLKKCMTGALAEGDYNTARKAAKTYDEYIQRRIDVLEFRRRISALEDVAERGRA
jgi:DNA-binding transcriptional ArsR family regulator